MSEHIQKLGVTTAVLTTKKLYARVRDINIITI